MDAQTIQQLIETHLPGSQVQVTGDDGEHFEAIIVSEAFAGLTPVRQHQLVYAALGDRMGQEIHALSIRTMTPAQWQPGAINR